MFDALASHIDVDAMTAGKVVAPTEPRLWRDGPLYLLLLRTKLVCESPSKSVFGQLA